MTNTINISKGDIVEARSPDGPMIIGQALTETYLGGPALVKIMLSTNNYISVDVNRWDVRVLYRNLLD